MPLNELNVHRKSVEAATAIACVVTTTLARTTVDSIVWRAVPNEVTSKVLSDPVNASPTSHELAVDVVNGRTIVVLLPAGATCVEFDVIGA